MRILAQSLQQRLRRGMVAQQVETEKLVPHGGRHTHAVEKDDVGERKAVASDEGRELAMSLERGETRHQFVSRFGLDCIG